MRIGALLLAGLLVASCTHEPAGVSAYGVSAGAGSAGIHTVLPGDTVYKVSESYQLPMREIITLNDISAPYLLRTGFRLKLPPPNEYRVQSGDTVNSIAQLYDVSASQLVRLNNLSAPYRLQLGQVLRLPTPTMRQEAVVRSVPKNISREDEGQTFTTARVNPVQREGVEPAVSRSTSTDNNNVVVPNKKPAVQNNEPARVQQASTVTRAKIPSTTPKASGSGKYMRPVSGRIISSYGPKADGLHNDGINIKAARGAPVRAAENGVVVYAGDDLEGYGNLILIRHEGKMMTAYAHLDKMLAKRGATVTRGQSIGTVGSTGQVDSPQLHFEVRKGSKPLNPGKYL